MHRYAAPLQLFDKVGAMRAIDPFCNLVTVNYLLAGIQLFSDIPECTAWRHFIRDIGMYDDAEQHNRIHTVWQVLQLVRDVFIPFGVPRGSDMQVRLHPHQTLARLLIQCESHIACCRHDLPSYSLILQGRPPPG